MDVVEKIKTELSSSPVVLFMKGTPDFPQCGFSAQTVAALRAVGADFKHINIFEEPEMREALKRYSNWPTYPQLYVNGELLGGCDIALEMYRNGELKKLLPLQDVVTIPIGAGTEAIAGEGMIVTAGGIDTHIHFICPQQIDEALASGITTMLGGGTGPATGTFATTCTPGKWNLHRMFEAAAQRL